MNGWNFIRLINALRHVSIMISSQDVCEAQICLARFPNISEKQIIKALLIHRSQDILMFESVWRILFDDNSIDAINGEEKEKDSIKQELNSPSIGGQGIGRGFGGLSLTNSLTNKSLREISLISNRQKLEMLVKEGAAFDDLVQAALTDLDYYTWINSYDLAYRRGTLTEEEWNILQEYQTLLMDEIRHQVIAIQVNQENCWQPLLRQHWLFKPLSMLTESEKNLVKSSIRKWARKLAVRTGQRWKTNQRGRIDLARIIRQSAQWDGLIFRLNYHQQIPSVPELVVLCDVSNSMAPFVEFLLFLVSCLRRRFRKLRVYFLLIRYGMFRVLFGMRTSIILGKKFAVGGIRLVWAFQITEQFLKN